ncbi:MAG TPA: hypothetical protein VJV79_01315 [Polyangiaceae bacterium]|nr:hypothetical protein [Polyangiaceae bacterium]
MSGSGYFRLELDYDARLAKYRDWLAESSLYDTSLVAHGCARTAEAQNDAAVIDEVQDLTNAELACA